MPVLAGLLVLAVLAFLFLRPGASGATPITTLDVLDVHSLAFSPDSADHVFFGHHNGVLESTDGGRTWKAPEGNTYRDAMNLAVPHPKGQAFYLAGHNVFQKSLDGGKTWQDVHSNLPGLDIHAFAVSPSDPNRLYAYVVGKGLFTSVDGGDTWAILTTQF